MQEKGGQLPPEGTLIDPADLPCLLESCLSLPSLSLPGYAFVRNQTQQDGNRNSPARATPWPGWKASVWTLTAHLGVGGWRKLFFSLKKKKMQQAIKNHYGGCWCLKFRALRNPPCCKAWRTSLPAQGTSILCLLWGTPYHIKKNPKSEGQSDTQNW